MIKFRQTCIAAAALAISAGSAYAADAIGIPACDDFLTKYDACISAKVPAEQQAQTKAALDGMRAQWKAAAANPQSKTALETGCKQMADAVKQQTAALSCAW
jgi:hypothetical protein